jgi:hypothetical protein
VIRFFGRMNLTESGEPEGRLLQQLVIRDASGARHSVPLNIAWSADVLRQTLTHRGIQGGTLVEIYLDPEHVERVRPMNEWEFDVLRRFIRYGDLLRTNPVQITNERIIAEIGRGVVLRDCGHIVSIETTYNAVYARLQFFMGPSAIPSTWVVRIADARIPPQQMSPSAFSCRDCSSMWLHYQASLDSKVLSGRSRLPSSLNVSIDQQRLRDRTETRNSSGRAPPGAVLLRPTSRHRSRLTFVCGEQCLEMDSGVRSNLLRARRLAGSESRRQNK